MGKEGVEHILSLTDEIDIRVILEEQRKAEAKVAEAKKVADEIIGKAREQAKRILAEAQEVALRDDLKTALEEEQRKARESLLLFEKQEAEKLEVLKSALASNRDLVRKMLLEALLG